MKTDIPTPKWLPLGEISIPDPLLGAYKLPDYPGEKTGQGRVVDLYDLNTDEPSWTGQLWTNDKDATAIVLDSSSDSPTKAAIVALRLRALRHLEKKSATQAFDRIIELFDRDLFGNIVSGQGARNLRTVDLETVTGKAGSGDTIKP